MATTLGLPEGFELDQKIGTTGLPEGFELDSPSSPGMDLPSFKSALLQNVSPTLPSYVTDTTKPITTKAAVSKIEGIQGLKGTSTMGISHPEQEKAGEILRAEYAHKEALRPIEKAIEKQPSFYKGMTAEDVLRREKEQTANIGEVTAPVVDPIDFATFIFGGGLPSLAKTALTGTARQATSKVIELGLKSAAIGAAQIPIGQATDIISDTELGKRYPQLPIAFNFLANGAAIYGIDKAVNSLVNSTIWRQLSIPEKQIVSQSIENLKANGMSEGQIARYYPSYKADLIAKRMPTETPTSTISPAEAVSPTFNAPTFTNVEPIINIAPNLNGSVKAMFDFRLADYQRKGMTFEDAAMKAFDDINDTQAGSSQVKDITVKMQQEAKEAEVKAQEETQKAVEAKKEPEKQSKKPIIETLNGLKSQYETIFAENPATTPEAKLTQKTTLETVNKAIAEAEEKPVFNQSHLEFIRDRLIASEPPMRVGIGEEVKQAGGYPDWFKNKGYTRDTVNKTIDKALQDKPLTNNQQDILDDLLKSSNKEYNAIGKEKIYPDQLAEGQKVIINGEEFTREGTLLKDGEDIPIDPFEKIKVDKVLPIKEKGIKPSQSDMFGTIKGTMEGKIPSVETPETPLEKATKEAETRRTEEEMMKRQPTFADVGGYARGEKIPSIVEMPEITELAKELLSGKYPAIVKRLRAAAGQALGQFIPKGTGSIKLKADIFKDPEIAAKVFSHEIGHLVDYLPDQTMAKGNILGRIASLKKYMSSLLEEAPTGKVEPFEPIWKKITLEDRAKLRREAERQSKLTGGRQRVNVSPEDILDIWRKNEGWDKELYDYVARLSGFDKKALMQKALSGVLPDWFKFNYSVAPEDVKAIYRQLVEDEIIRRGLFKREDIMNELKTLTQRWKPFDEKANPIFTKYRYSPKELYADAFSVLINDPKMLDEIAPTFYKAFFNWMDAKPEVKTLYENLQVRLGNPEEVIQKRDVNIEEMFGRGESKLFEAQAKQKTTIKDILLSLKHELVDTNSKMLQKVKEIEKGAKIPPQDNPRYWLEELPYTSSEVLNMLRDINKAKVPLNDIGISDTDIGKYMMLKRISTERAEMANPLGHTKETALKHLEYMQKTLGTDKFKALEEGVVNFREMRKKNVLSVIKKSNMLDDETMELIKNAENYATFDVQTYIEKRYGRNIGSRIYQQIGTLQEITNPFVATIMKDTAMLRAANRKMAADNTIQFLQTHFPGEIKESETKWNGRYQEPIESKDPQKGSITFLQKGKVQSYDVDKYIAKSFQSDPYEAGIILRAFQMLTRPFKEFFVSKNPAFIMWNIQRDIRAFAKQVPGASLVKAVEYAIKSVPDAYKDIFKNLSTEDVAEMYHNKELIVGRIYGGQQITESTQLERLLASYSESPVAYHNKLTAPFRAVWDWLDKPGQLAERVTKIAGHKFLKDKGLNEKEIAHIVRTRAGSPDFKRAGSLVQLYNNLFLFSNAGKEGIRASFEAFKENKSRYMWQTVKYDLIPKMLMYAAGIGVFGATLQKMFNKIPDRDKTNYMTIPVGTTENGKTVYLVMPHDFQAQLIAGLLWKSLEVRQAEDVQEVLDYTSGGIPYSGLNPVIGNFYDISQYMTGKNPYDSWSGRYVIPELTFTAGGGPANEVMLKHLANNLGMASLVYRFPSDNLNKVKSDLEKILDIPFAGRVIERFVRVSNRGETETFRKVSEDVEQKRAKENIKIKETIMDDIAADKPTTLFRARSLYENMVKSGEIQRTQWNDFYETYKLFSIRKYDQPVINAYLNAKSKEAKLAIIQKYLEIENQK